MNKTHSMDNEYVQVSSPDIAKLAEYIKQAKGENRTMAEFAQDCNSVSPSTFSRIMQGHIINPLSVELIKAITDKADRSAGLSLDDLMRANGMISKSELARQGFSGSNREREKFYADIKHFIADELYSRGCMLRIYSGLSKEELPESEFYLPRRSRLAVTVQGYEPGFWNFIIHIPFSDHYKSLLGETEDEQITGSMKRIISDWSFIFLRDMWEPEKLRDVKHSFVFTEERLYEAFCDTMMKIRVNTYMSVILIDMAKEKIIEKMIPRYDQKTLTSIFELQKQTDYSQEKAYADDSDL